MKIDYNEAARIFRQPDSEAWQIIVQRLREIAKTGDVKAFAESVASLLGACKHAYLPDEARAMIREALMRVADPD